MSKPTKYKDKQTGVLVDAWQVPKPFMPTMYKPRWVLAEIAKETNVPGRDAETRRRP